MEGSSRRANKTFYARGTNSYRAPELLDCESGQPGEYTNKVDMWAVGCILYELVLRRKAFPSDWGVFQYKACGKEFDVTIGLEIIPEERKREFIVKITKELLTSARCQRTLL
jgi:serine/threonine protein kinase